MRQSLSSVNAYITAAPPKARAMMKQLRAVIKSAAPKAEEKISYGIPYYGDKGRLIYFAAFKSHVGVYIMGGSRAALPKVLQQYRKTNATLQLPLGIKIPVAAIKTIVRAQMKVNEANARRLEKNR